MYRFFEYTDADGKRWGSMQNASGATRQQANRLLAETARVGRWTDVHVYPESMPGWEIKKRTNAIQQKNDQPLIYSEEETQDPASRPAVSVPTFTITDHEDKSTIETPILATSVPQLTREPTYAPGSAPPVPIIDHAG